MISEQQMLEILAPLTEYTERNGSWDDVAKAFSETVSYTHLDVYKRQALEYVKLGYYIGVGGVVTFKNAKKLVQTVSELPLDRILLETDCPYTVSYTHLDVYKRQVDMVMLANGMKSL